MLCLQALKRVTSIPSLDGQPDWDMQIKRFLNMRPYGCTISIQSI